MRSPWLNMKVLTALRPALLFRYIFLVWIALLEHSSEGQPNDLDSVDGEHDVTNKKKKILCLGGNGMIGSEVLSRLIPTNEYDITLVSRGFWPHDSYGRIRPHVNHITCDRSGGLDDEDHENGVWHTNDNALRLCPDLMEEIAATEMYYAVLDFSGYHPEWIDNAIEVLSKDLSSIDKGESGTRANKARVYVYASADSVYEVSSATASFVETGHRLVETDAVRPSDEKEQRRLNEEDPYGDFKLEGEEVLAAQRAKGGIPYVSLRFADVLGPRDNTGRWLTYHAWTKFAPEVEGIPSLHIRGDVAEASSITYVNDAASAIILAMEGGENVWDEAYNVACEEIFNITEALSTMSAILHGENKLSYPVRKLLPQDSFALYPSVGRGPVDVTKATRKLNFVPTSLEMVLEETIEWYEEQFKNDRLFREEMILDFAHTVLDEEDLGADYDSVVEKLWDAAGLEMEWGDGDEWQEDFDDGAYDGNVFDGNDRPGPNLPNAVMRWNDSKHVQRHASMAASL